MKRISNALRTSLEVVASNLFQDFVVERNKDRRQGFKILAGIVNLPLYRIALLCKRLYKNRGDQLVRGLHLTDS